MVFADFRASQSSDFRSGWHGQVLLPVVFRATLPRARVLARATQVAITNLQPLYPRQIRSVFQFQDFRKSFDGSFDIRCTDHQMRHRAESVLSGGEQEDPSVPQLSANS